MLTISPLSSCIVIPFINYYLVKVKKGNSKINRVSRPLLREG
jgi:hypothetical protein